METTPQRTKLSIRKLKNETQKEFEAKDQDNDNSPLYFPSTQECSEEFDVLWDWNSPQTSQRKRVRQKRLLPVHSPILPVKKQNPLIQSQNFEKLRSELIALKEELSKPDVDSYLCVSPQEMEFKLDEDVEHQRSLEELFSDSIDEQAILFSQKIEDQLRRKDDVERITRHEPPNNTYQRPERMNNTNKTINKQVDTESWPLLEDSFDDILSNFDPDLQQTQIVSDYVDKPNKVSFSRALSDNSYSKTTNKKDFKKSRSFDTNETILPQSTLDEIERKRLEALAKLEAKKSDNIGKTGFNRTKSFDIPSTSQEYILPQSKLEEIERKRLEALAKREAKKKPETATLISDDEIEKKRREAIAKREAKKLQEMIERNRQEALKKLRLKKAASQKHSS